MRENFRDFVRAITLRPRRQIQRIGERAQQEMREVDQAYDLIKDSISRHLNYGGTATNHDIYEPRLTAKPRPIGGFDYVPRCIYFYYVRIDQDGRLKVDHYFYNDGPLGNRGQWNPIRHAEVPGLVQLLAINGRRTGSKDPPALPSQDFSSIPWRRKSYIALFFDEANWSFHKRDGGKPSVAFDPVAGTPNHSFFDAADIEVDMPKAGNPLGDKRTAIYFINHMKRNAAGEDLGYETQPFKFDMWLKARFANNPGSSISVNIDPGDVNTGPPLQP